MKRRCLSCSQEYLEEQSDAMVKEAFCSYRCESQYTTLQRQIDLLIEKLKQDNHQG